MASLFDAEGGQYIVLVNKEGQHSLWPVLLPVPLGWDTVLAASSRTACLEFVERHWIDLRAQNQ